MRKNIELLALGLVLSVSLFAAGCGTSKDGDAQGAKFGSHSEEYQYQYKVNGCDTGSHSFKSLESYCSGLSNSALNNGCAVGMRQDTFEKANCPGTFSNR